MNNLNKDLLFETVKNNLKKQSKDQLINKYIDILWHEARPQLFTGLSLDQYNSIFKGDNHE